MKRTYILYLSLIISFALNAVFGYRIYIDGRRSENSFLKVGTIVSAFEAADSNGYRQTIDFRDEEERETVLYVFNPSCPRSEQNLENLKELVLQKHRAYRFVGIALSREGLPEYLTKKNLRMPVVTDLSDSTREELKLNGTPQTIVVSTSGEVIQTWTGPYSGKQQKQVEYFFGMALPGTRAEDR